MNGGALTVREIEVLNHAADGLTGEEIAERMWLGVGTVKYYFDGAYSKLGVNNRFLALVAAHRLGYINILSRARVDHNIHLWRRRHTRLDLEARPTTKQAYSIRCGETKSLRLPIEVLQTIIADDIRATEILTEHFGNHIIDAIMTAPTRKDAA